MLKKAKPYINHHSLMLLYNGIVSPNFDYCDTIWGTCNNTEFEKVQKLQNRAAKIINGMTRYDSSTEALSVLKWKTLKERQEFHASTIMYKTINDQMPKYLSNKFNFKNISYNMRGYKNLEMPKPRTDFMKRAISYYGAKTWNNLPNSLKDACNLSQFKCNYGIFKD